MENNTQDQFFVVPLMGGILCLIQFFAPNIIFSLYFDVILFFGWIILVINNIVFGIIMIVSAVRLKNQRRTLADEKTKLMVLSWISIGAPLGFGSFYLIISPIFTGSFSTFFIIPNTFGIAGGMVVILGLFLKIINERNMISSVEIDDQFVDTHLIESEEPSELKAKKLYKFCPDCGLYIQGKNYSYCPNCGSKIN